MQIIALKKNESEVYKVLIFVSLLEFGKKSLSDASKHMDFVFHTPSLIVLQSFLANNFHDSNLFSFPVETSIIMIMDFIFYLKPLQKVHVFARFFQLF